MIYATQRVGCNECQPRRVGQADSGMDFDALAEFTRDNPEGFNWQFVGGTTEQDIADSIIDPKPKGGLGEWGGLGLAALLLFLFGGALAPPKSRAA